MTAAELLAQYRRTRDLEPLRPHFAFAHVDAPAGLPKMRVNER